MVSFCKDDSCFISFQHVVVKVVLGTKKITRFRSSLKEFLSYASENVRKALTG